MAFIRSVSSKLFSKVNNVFMTQSAVSIHTPVMVNEVLSYLCPSKNDLFIDMTFGTGGHTKALLDAEPSLKVISLDRDPHAYEIALKVSKQYPGRLIPCLGRFSELSGILNKLDIKKSSINGFLFDLGCSSDQFDIAERGFAISKNGPLDMRMDGDRFLNSPTALDVIKRADERDLIRIFKVYGEEKMAKKVARALVESRYSFRNIKTTQDLADFIYDICDSNRRVDKLQRPAHIATKVFQSLRIFINNELNELDYGMLLAKFYLKENGRVVTLAYHSLEDRIVKRHLTGAIEEIQGNLNLKYSNGYTYYDDVTINDLKESPWKVITKHVIVPSEEEVKANPRSRSAKLRAAVRV